MLEKPELKNSNLDKRLIPHPTLQNWVNTRDETKSKLMNKSIKKSYNKSYKNEKNSHKNQKGQSKKPVKSLDRSHPQNLSDQNSSQTLSQIPYKTPNMIPNTASAKTPTKTKSLSKHSPNQKDLREERQQKRVQINKMYIFQAAEKILIRKGYSAMTMDDVARESQFSKATIYQYFKGKGELIYEVAASYLEDLNQQIVRIKSRDTDASTKLKEVIRCVSRFHREKENIARVFLMDKSFIERMRIFLKRQRPSSNLDKKFLQMVKAYSSKISNHVADILSEGIDSDEFDQINLNEAVAFLASTLQGFCHQKYWFKKHYNLNQETDLITNFFLYGISSKDTKNSLKKDIKDDVKNEPKNDLSNSGDPRDILELGIEPINSIESIERNTKEK